LAPARIPQPWAPRPGPGTRAQVHFGRGEAERVTRPTRLEADLLGSAAPVGLELERLWLIPCLESERPDPPSRPAIGVRRDSVTQTTSVDVTSKSRQANDRPRECSIQLPRNSNTLRASSVFHGNSSRRPRRPRTLDMDLLSSILVAVSWALHARPVSSAQAYGSIRTGHALESGMRYYRDRGGAEGGRCRAEQLR
jgi:hypothetical protein